MIEIEIFQNGKYMQTYIIDLDKLQNHTAYFKINESVSRKEFLFNIKLEKKNEYKKLAEESTASDNTGYTT